jgi:hypothetical protein
MSDDLYSFQFAGGPIDAPEAATDVFLAIGHVAASWSRLEQHIDALLLHVNKAAHSATLYRPEHPVAFSGKLDLLKRWFSRHPVLKRLAPHMGELTSRLKSHGKERNRYLHSILDTYNPATKAVTFRSVRYSRDGKFRFSKQTVALLTIRTFADIVNDVNRFLWSMSSDIFTEDALKQLQTP